MPTKIQDSRYEAATGAQREAIVTEGPHRLGVVTKFVSWETPEEALKTFLNGDLTDVTLPRGRDGYVVVGNNPADDATVIADALADVRIGGMGFLNPDVGNRLMAITIPNAGAGKTYFTSDLDSGSWNEALVDPGGTPLSFDPESNNTPMFQANNLLWMLPESTATPPNDHIHAMDAAGELYDAGDSATDIGLAPTGAVHGAYMLNRVWLLVDSGPTELHWSKLLPESGDFGVTGDQSLFNTVNDATEDPPLANSQAGMIVVSPNRGGRPVAVVPWNETSLLIFFENSIEEILIDSGNPLQSVRRVIEQDVGCLSWRAISVLGDEVYFMDQYAELRALRQTDGESKRGVLPEPLSEPIRPFLPGEINDRREAFDKVALIRYRSNLMAFWPRGSRIEADRGAVFDVGQRIWTGAPWQTADAQCNWLVANMLRGGREQPPEFYATNSESTDDVATVEEATIYRWFAGTYSDAGVDIDVELATVGHDAGSPESDKTVEYVETRSLATGAVPYRVSVAASLIADPYLIGEYTTEAAGDFPLLEDGTDADDFPLLEDGTDTDDFPLNEGSLVEQYDKFHPGASLVPQARQHILKWGATQNGAQADFAGYVMSMTIHTMDKSVR